MYNNTWLVTMFNNYGCIASNICRKKNVYFIMGPGNIANIALAKDILSTKTLKHTGRV